MEQEQHNNTVVTEPDAERERLKADVDREHDMYLRALADFDNYRRRAERDRENAVTSAKRDIFAPLLEVLDGFDRAFPYMSAAPPPVAEGVQAIYRRLVELLGAQSVSSFNAVGERFDPAVHEAVDADESGGYSPGTVTDEVQRGYRFGDELLRPARVRVAR
jgi:molecular chaperone GrpE